MTEDQGGYCSWEVGQTHNLRHQPQIWVKKWETIKFDVVEIDDVSVHDSTTISLTADKWFFPTDDTYSILVTAEFGSQVTRDSCVNFGADVNFVAGGVNGAYEDCSHWETRAENYILDVKISKFPDYNQGHPCCKLPLE